MAGSGEVRQRKERLRGSIFFIENVVFDRLGDFFLFEMYVAGAGDVQIFPEEALAIDERLQELLDDFIFDVHDFEEKLYNAYFFPLFFLIKYYFFILIFDFVPRSPDLQREVILPDT